MTTLEPAGARKVLELPHEFAVRVALMRDAQKRLLDGITGGEPGLLLFPELLNAEREVDDFLNDYLPLYAQSQQVDESREE